VSAPKLCPTCSAEYPATERFCPRDGTALRAPGAETGDLVGTIIAERYHVLEKLGEGGMGQVYLAEHVKMGRRSAVKVMNPSMVHDAGAIGRFNREAANASRIPSGSDSQRRVEPSMSVRRKVTTPEGSSAPAGSGRAERGALRRCWALSSPAAVTVQPHGPITFNSRIHPRLSHSVRAASNSSLSREECQSVDVSPLSPCETSRSCISDRCGTTSSAVP